MAKKYTREQTCGLFLLGVILGACVAGPLTALSLSKEPSKSMTEFKKSRPIVTQGTNSVARSPRAE
jgi:hypothetical protein